MAKPQAMESQNFLMLILFGPLLKVLFDFKKMGGFNYPLSITLLYMIMVILELIL